MLKRMLLLCLAGISLALLWFTVRNYRNSLPLADEMLFGISHSLHAAIEFSVFHDPTLQTLSRFHSHDIVYFALIDNKGVFHFHSNADLIGTRLQDEAVLKEMSSETMTGKRVVLATGEEAYELLTHVHMPDGTLGLRLVLHTYRADAIIRSARISMVVMGSLLVLSWCLSAVIYRYARREDYHQLELARQENLARIGEMGAMLAHEIRNPLAGIKGFAQLIEKKPEGPNTKDSAQKIIVETHRLEELTTDLLAFARSDEFPVTAIPVAAFFKQIKGLVRHETEQFGIIFNVDCPEGLEIRGNNDRLTQVSLNIIKNGIQAMPDGGTLMLAVKTSGSNILTTVTDTGHGIDPKDMSRVFEPFFTTKARGTGLGLALCKKIIEEHYGSIDIESSPVGTIVSIVLPAEQSKEKRI
jgi:two-component system sensor histidine kinase HydH